MDRWLRITGYVLIGLLAGVALAVTALFLLTRTEFGAERVRRFLVGQFEESVRGRLQVGRVTTRNLLGEVTVHGVSIDDAEGEPFVRVDSARLAYDWRDLLAGRIVFRRATVYGPRVYLERVPGDTAWNYQEVFPPSGEPGRRRLILFQNARIVDGLAEVRYPFEPEGPVEPGDTARLILESTPSGLVRVLRFEGINGFFRSILWETPEEKGRRIDAAELAVRGYVYRQPFDVRDLEGTTTIRDSVIAFEWSRLVLPESRGSILGRVVLREGREFIDLRIEGEEVRLRDLQWLYAPLPGEGEARMTLRVQTQPVGTLWLATDARVVLPRTRVAGTFGIVAGDTLYFTQVDLRASPLDLEEVERILPGRLPVQGLLVGTVEVEGPISSLETAGDLRLTRGTRAGGSAVVRWNGTLDLRDRFGVRSLQADVRRLDLAVLAALRPDLRLAGTVSGRFTAAERERGGIRFEGSLQHRLDGRVAAEVRGRGTVGRGGSTVDVQLDAGALELEALSRAFPWLGGLQGTARGPVSLKGPLSDLAVSVDLETPAGLFPVRGRLDLTGEAPRYQAEGEVSAFRLSELVKGLPPTVVTGRFALEGSGGGFAKGRAGLDLQVTAGEVGGVAVHGAVLRGGFDSGLARLDTLFVSTAAGRVEAGGTLGLVADRTGSLRVQVSADSLVALRPLLFPDTLSEGGAGGRVGGSFELWATLSGTRSDLSVDVEALLDAVAYDRIATGKAGLRLTAWGVGTERMRLEASVDADTLRFYGVNLNRARVATTVDGRAGELSIEALGPRGQEYWLASGFGYDGQAAELELRELRLGEGPTGWTLVGPARARAEGGAITLSALELTRGDGSGRIHAEGKLPWDLHIGEAAPGPEPPGNFRLTLERVPIGELLQLVGPEPALDGVLDGSLEVLGEAYAPAMNAEVAVSELRYRDARLDRLDARVSYVGRLLDGRFEARQGDRPVLAGRGRIPVDLALAPLPERRLPQPMELDVWADSLPAAFLAGSLRGFRDVRGWVSGGIAVGGTTIEPEATGTLFLEAGAMTWQPSGVRYRDVRGTFSMGQGGVVSIDARGRTEGGEARVTGTVTLRPANDPAFDLVLRAQGFELARRREVELTGSGEVRLRGRYSEPLLSGLLYVDRGALYLDELWRQHQIVELDNPLLFDVVDTSAVAVRNILPAAIESPFLRNLRVDGATIQVGRDSWLRSREMNVEVTGELAVTFNRRDSDLRLSGSLAAVRGTYQVYGRRFQVQGGTVEFFGTPGLDPNLDITALYRLARAGNDPLNIEAVLTGTLRSPRVSLRSDAEPPISESDLASYLLFGRPTYALAASESQALGLTTAAAQLGAGFAAPSVFGFAATGLEAVADKLVDYVAITAPDVGDNASAFGSFFAGTQFEVGRYLGDDLFAVVSQRLIRESGGTTALGTPGARIEWRFHPSWTGELFWEDRFARLPSFGIQDAVVSRKVLGVFLSREWGY
jgi:translocation and assembly module TamB